MRYRRYLAALAAGMMLAGGIGSVPATADVYLHNPRGAGSRAVAVTRGDPGNGNGQKAIIIGDPGGDGPGPKVRA